ncbi:head-tail joining protein [Pararobbsia silviterrae]|uniref:Head-tail adaptor protein n=1 Tax=Pararobbsia silviterrae TaxID=1792498 RepID=A0A494WZ42_9BURK|nr:hypothetical protein [Pararobbsia silviterrae]RKP43798.1 hypothetical protein D7S86_28430 [Pararobbsia silviterrae]
MFDAGVFWAAFAAAGMLKTAYVDDVPGGVQVGFATPDQLDLDGQVTVAEYQIEYQAADLPALARGSIIKVDEVCYRVRRPPRRKDDGFFMLADLEVAK